MVALLLDALVLVAELAALDDWVAALELLAFLVVDALLEYVLLELAGVVELSVELLCVSSELDELLSIDELLESSELELLSLLLLLELSFLEEFLLESVDAEFLVVDSVCVRTEPPSVVPVTLFTTTLVALSAIKTLTIANGVINGGVRYAITASPPLFLNG